jgi:ribosomal protein S18 acetylase RimI-like enzyme
MGRRDCVRDDAHLAKVMAGLDWEASTRIVEGHRGKFDGAVLVFNRATPLGTVTAIEATAADDQTRLLDEITGWGIGLSRAAGAVAAQVWRGRGHTDGLSRLGMQPVRPWWRMDRPVPGERVEPSPVAGYRLQDPGAVPVGEWETAHNLAFADHWRFSPRTEQELMAGRPRELSLVAVTAGGETAALTLCQVETYAADPRPQPVGVVSSVGTLPGHRRRGLATWLVAESLVRLERAVVCYTLLYLDGFTPTRAFVAYTKLGFELAFEAEVWEANFQ